MTWRVTVSAAAEDEIAEAVDWYEQRGRGLGARLLDDLADRIDRIADNPLQYAVVHRQARRVLLRRFPYGLIYRALDSEVEVIAFFHTSRDPRRWRART